MKWKAIAILVLSAVITTTAAAVSSVSRAEGDAVDAVRVRRVDITDGINCPGKAEGGGSVSVEAGSVLKFTKVYVKQGERVKKGDLLFTAKKAVNDSSAAASAVIKSAADSSGELMKKAVGQVGEGVVSEEDVNAIVRKAMNDASTLHTDAYQLDETETNFYAPADGVITDVSAREGELVSASFAAVTLTETANMLIRCEIPESYLSVLKEGQSASMTSVAYPGRVYTGTVKQIYRYAKQSGGLLASAQGQSETVVDVLVALDAAPEEILPGLSMQTRIVTRQIPNAELLPYESILQDDGGNEYVFVIKNGATQKRYIETGLEVENGMQVTAGLASEEAVVLNPTDDMTGGQRVRAVFQ